MDTTSTRNHRNGNVNGTLMAKFKRFDPRNKKDNRNKNISLRKIKKIKLIDKNKRDVEVREYGT